MTLIEATILDDVKDGLENLVSGMGTEGDKRIHGKFNNKRQLSAITSGTSELSAMYRSNWVAGKVVDIIPDDMTREWREFDGDMDPKLVEKINAEQDRIQLPYYFNLAHKWGRLFGTAFIVMSVDDGKEPSAPLDIASIKEGDLKHIKVIDRHRLTRPTTISEDPMSVNFGLPEFYTFANQSNVKIHHTRLLRFDGVTLPYDELIHANYWSDSVIDRLYDPILDFITTSNSAASMVFETNVDVVKVEGLMDQLSNAKNEKALLKRFHLSNMLKSFNNMFLMDKGEDYEKKSNTFAGLPELLDKFAQVLSAASDIPATRLLGSSASGLNATGEGDLKNYYDMIKSKQTTMYKPLLDYFDPIMAASLGFNEPLTYKFKPLFQMTPIQEAAIGLQNSQRDAAYLDRGVVPESVVAKDLKKSGTYKSITDEHIELLEEIEEEIANADPEEEEVKGSETNGAGSEKEESEGPSTGENEENKNKASESKPNTKET